MDIAYWVSEQPLKSHHSSKITFRYFHIHWQGTDLTTQRLGFKEAL